MAGFAIPGPYSGYAPSTEATGGLLIGYARNEKDWAVLRITKTINVKQMVGLYIKWASQQAARISSDGSAEEWADGTIADSGVDNVEAFQMEGYRTKRYRYAFGIGELTAQQATFGMVVANQSVEAQRCMTQRTNMCYRAIASATYPSGQNVIVDNAGAGGALFASGDNFATGTTANPYIKIALNDVAVSINQNTLGKVTPAQLKIVMNPNTARTMSQSQEIQDLVKQSIWGMAQLRGDSAKNNGQWGLPDKLYNYEVEVDPTVMSTGLRPSFTPIYAMPENTIYVLARIGALEGLLGEPSFSTVCGFFYGGEMVTELKNDIDNKMILGRIITNYQYVVVAPESGGILTDVFGVSAPTD